MSSAPRTWPELLSALLERHDLPRESTAWAMREIMRGDASAAQIAAFMIALRAKGETVGEVDGLIEAMYAEALPFGGAAPSPGLIDALDIVGTGGDRAHTVNISTMAAVVAAAAGARVVKHGNRAASSSCGSADVLDELGVRLDLPPEKVAEVFDETGITFCFAAAFHPSMRHAAAPRREMGVLTTFNFLGPLANPARPRAQAIGVADAAMADVMAGVLAGRGVSALVFRGDDGLDELTTATTSRIWVVHDGEVAEERFDPAVLGLEPAAPDALRGGDPAYNADVARRVFAGETGPVRDAVLLNAAAGLAAYDGSRAPLTDRLADGLERARDAVESGAAEAILQRWIAAGRRA
ncbi:anthranilate phosphoribosyltransferase [Actinobacteria bacterium YIM 96077]|uniref:Anthranilate phosphoribosyltransferase n=1 Tax=Phytoactinopolyspora halophila TaxID=1981511 RepID=A0A329QFK3_9ACTN|nr:anthranilate phosphoribosyltransferase [Phytoactinopolyspora halophila]AYY13671.1 anthranilate phosphoribosyltransferase [Actinobacteria bacterium YIM 96077]RAW11235.1 anthranilate phosphoribosyltransferase [Phytoactinopolyspora halophila]